MSAANQLSFLPATPLRHGGGERKRKRKTARPLDPKRPLHLTLKSSRAAGEWSLLHPRNCRHVESRVRAIAKRRHVRVYRFVNVGNHLHLLLQVRTRLDFQAFLRELAGSLASLVTGAKKGNPVGGYWDALAWSRVVSWGRDWKGVLRYLIKNIFEAEGLLTPALKRAGYRIVSLEIERPPPGGPSF